MKKLVYVLMSAIFCMAFAQRGMAQTSDSVLAKEFIALNASGKFDETQTMFAPALQGQVSPAMLESIWNGLVKKYGAYEAMSGIDQMQHDSLTILLPVLDFHKARLTLSLAYGPSQLLYGYRIVDVQEKGSSASLIPNTTSVDTSVQVNGGRLYGTLLIPDTPQKVPVALIIAGSGPTDRNGNSGIALQTSTYRMLADSLAVHGIASFRYDKRYVGKSTDFNADPNDVKFNDYVNDAIHLVHFLNSDKKFSQIILIGHSEGSLIGMLAAEKTKAAAYISLEGAGQSIGKILQWQLAQQPIPDQDRIKTIIDSIGKGYLVKNIPQYLQTTFSQSVQPFLTSWIQYDPAKEITKLKIPVLIVNGTTDIQVTVQQAELLHKAKPDARLAIIPGMNHILKNAPENRTDNIATYGNPDLPLNAELVQQIVSFIHSLPSHNHS